MSNDILTQNDLRSMADVFPPLINDKLELVRHIFMSFQREYGSVDHSLNDRWCMMGKYNQMQEPISITLVVQYIAIMSTSKHLNCQKMDNLSRNQSVMLRIKAKFIFLSPQRDD